jgi:hypothetical protein
MNVVFFTVWPSARMCSKDINHHRSRFRATNSRRKTHATDLTLSTFVPSTQVFVAQSLFRPQCGHTPPTKKEISLGDFMRALTTMRFEIINVSTQYRQNCQEIGMNGFFAAIGQSSTTVELCLAE